MDEFLQIGIIGFHSASSLKQSSIGIHVALIRHIILILSHNQSLLL